jgi:hypothetical protein
MKVLFVNHKQQQCGVYQFGKRVYELSRLSKLVNYTYIETDSFNEFLTHYNNAPDVIIYNWYPLTMSWLTEEFISTSKNVKHFFIFHDGNIRKNFDKYLFFGDYGSGVEFLKEKSFLLPRPLFKYYGTYSKNEFPTIGSFGFGGWQKGFTSIVEKVNAEFDNAIINIQMPFAYFGDRLGKETIKIAQKCRELNKKPGITLNIDHTFLSNAGTLEFLAKNDLNLFMYRAVNQGLSSAIDYAISVDRPFGITSDSMFKHVYTEEVDANTNTIMKLIGNTRSRSNLYNRWNPDNFYLEMDKIYAY